MLPQQPHAFGPELRRRRLAADLSLDQLGRRVHYSKGQLSKVERGLKLPTPQLARLCDEELGARGALAGLVPAPAPAQGITPTSHEGEVWLMHLDKDGSGSFQPVGRRRVISAGAASVLGIGVGGMNVTTGTGATTLVDASRALFGQYRRLGQVSGPGALLPQLISQTHSLQQLAARSGTRTRQALLVLASRFAEYTGWMAQESGNDDAALWWTDRAVELAGAGNDDSLAAYALARRSLISLFRGDTDRAVDLATHALDSQAPPRIKGLAAQKLAQCQAVKGDYDACMRSLDRSRNLLALERRDPHEPVIGASHLPDVVAMFTGWCLYELGRPRQAAEILGRETARLPGHALRTRSRYELRRALAHAAAGEIELACEVTRGLLPTISLVQSATITADLRRLARTLGRHPRNASVRELSPELSTTLAAAPR
ncbi:helix-turn-helix domain-containing protein [Streptomyces rimosus]|uniref:helix-turn-helix domain-containing protein n=1 Tax=Streptomyces rimosus TaxID=1927 RepID=UPI0004BEB230|nr:helix-turn-helix transcriptional regulator [Streptomyces rimosus]